MDSYSPSVQQHPPLIGAAAFLKVLKRRIECACGYFLGLTHPLPPLGANILANVGAFTVQKPVDDVESEETPVQAKRPPEGPVD